MFNRKLQVDVVKKAKTQPAPFDHQGISFETKATIVSRVVEKGIKKIVIGVCAYVILDTVRRVAVESSKK